MAQLGRRDEAIVIAIKDLAQQLAQLGDASFQPTNLERLADLLLRIGVLHLPRHHREEL